MRVRFWGTRGSIAKPGPTTLRYGGNTSCVEVQARDGTLIILDCGTGAHGLGKALAASKAGARRGHLLVSHTHWDHIQGFPFFAPLRDPDAEWDVYGPRDVGTSFRQTLAGQMSFKYFPVDITGLDAHVRYHELVEGEFELGDVRVEARYLNHPAVTIGYRLETDGVVVVYATDHEPHSRRLAVGEEEAGPALADDAHASFLEGADLVIHDTQYTADEYPRHVGWGHSTVEYVVDRTRDKGIRRLALFHHDPMRDDDGVDRIVARARDRLRSASEPMHVFGAAEGMVLHLEPLVGRAGPRAVKPSARREPRLDTISRKVVLGARDPDTLATFRDAADADGLELCEARDVEHVIELTEGTLPPLAIVERGLVRDRIEHVVRRIRDPVHRAGRNLTLVGLMPESEACAPHQRVDPVMDEWVTTPMTREYARSRMRAWLLRVACRWKRARAPDDEPVRIQALHDLKILDTPPEARFDRFTRIAAELFDVPTALISLVDHDRQWFKSKQGLDAEQTPRDQAFCAHAILGSDVFQVSDARKHPDFADNPLVTGPPYVRFYAGVPLTVFGRSRVGTLCLLASYPRSLNDRELGLLRDLGRLVALELERGAPGSDRSKVAAERRGTRPRGGISDPARAADRRGGELDALAAGTGGNVQSLASAVCSDDPALDETPPVAGFDTYVGTGTGRLNGVPGATIWFRFTDEGEPGKNDKASIIINDGIADVLNVLGVLKNGKHQAHEE